jgi:hypothetical protein
MRITRMLGLLATLVVAGAWPAAAQFGGGAGMRPPEFRGVLNPVVGSGAAYQMTGAKGDKNEMEITIVGKDSVAGKDAFWLEMGFNSPQGQMYMKTLMAIDASKNTAISRMIMQMPGRPPMEMPEQMINMTRGNAPPQSADIRDNAQLVGTEDVTVPAGTFSCEHYKAKDGKWDVWISSKVSPWGLVKSSGEGTEMVLVRTITGAADHITGTPVPFNMGGFGGPGGPGGGRPQ